MRTSTLFIYLETLTAAERREFSRWLASPLFKVHDQVQALGQYVLQHFDVAPDRLRKPVVFAALFPGQPCDERRLNHLMSWLLTQLRDYLTWLEGQTDEAAVHLLRCRALRKRGLFEAFDKELAQARQVLAGQSWRDEHWHTLQHQLFREQYERAALQSRRTDLPLAEMAAHADTAYRLNQLRHGCSAEIMRTVTSHREAAPPPQLPETTGIVLYENLLAALQNPQEEEAFARAKALLERHWPVFREEERRGLYLLALNYCIRKINGGQRNYMREALDLYKTGLANRALFENGVLSRFTYKNAVTAGLALGESDWIRRFLEDYRPFLPARERHAAYTYNLAVWHFHRAHYDEAMNLLRDTDFGQDVLTNLDARVLLLRIYYENDAVDALDSLLGSFQTYLRRQKDLGYQRENYLNLLRFVRRLVRLAPGDTDGRQALREEVAATKALAERGWLLEKCGGGKYLRLPAGMRTFAPRPETFDRISLLPAALIIGHTYGFEPYNVSI